MSRSRKHIPIVKDNSRGSKSAKKRANRKVRRTKMEDLPLKGSGYKKLFCQYDIHDWISYWSWQEALNYWQTTKNEWIKKKYPTKEKFYIHWYKEMIAK
jgi:hypothetical protein